MQAQIQLLKVNLQERLQLLLQSCQLERLQVVRMRTCQLCEVILQNRLFRVGDHHL